MSAIILDGKKLADKILGNIRSETASKKELAIISIGDDPASEVYVKNKIRACSKCNIPVRHFIFPKHVDETEIIGTIDSLNTDNLVGGIILQLPVPEGLDAQYLIDRIYPEKDVDGLSFENKGNLYNGIKNSIIPCTAKGVLALLDDYRIPTKGKCVVIIGRSDLVGRPLATILSSKERNATVILCNSYTPNLEVLCKQADILISAVGFPKLITADMVKKDAVVIDVGITRDENGKLCGDVDFEKVKEVAFAISPVPGGVGPMTVAMLIDNLPYLDWLGKF